MDPKKRILALSTGGTIEKSYCEAEGTIANRESVLKTKLARQLRLPHTELVVREIMAKDSLDLDDADRSFICQAIHEAAPEYDGIVVLHGTDTLEQTLELCHASQRAPVAPVVFTGAMRPAGFDDTDALQNFTEALLAAQILPPGLYLSFHSRVFSAPDIRKNRERSTFQRRERIGLPEDLKDHTVESALECIQSSRDDIITQWEKLAREMVRAAGQADALVLRDHLPAILDDLETALAGVASGTKSRQAGSIAFTSRRSREHGLHRASTENYTVEQVIHEFVILRHVLTDRLSQRGRGGIETIEAINRTLELSVLESCASFSESLQQVQQKLMGTLAHDIRTPLTIAHSSIDLLGNQSTSPNEALELREMARRGVERALSLLSDLLDSIRIKAGDGVLMRFVETDYRYEIQEACEGVKLVYADRLQVDLPEDPIPAVFCVSSIRRVLENLVSNAVKHGARAAPILVKLENGETDVTLSVRNEGPPISPADQESIFEFLATGSAPNGSPTDSWGIGLTLVKAVAEAHKGEVRIESDDERGTTFIVTLRKRPHPPGEGRVRLHPASPR